MKFRTLAAISILMLIGCSSGGSSDSDTGKAGGAGNAVEQAANVAANTMKKARQFQAISERDLFKKLEGAELKVERMSEVNLQEYEIAELPPDYKNMISVRVSDGKGNRTGMTFVEFEGQLSTRIRGVNGFPVRNWFVVGTVDNYFRDLIVDAVN